MVVPLNDQYTKLNDRILWFDGDTSIDVDQLEDFVCLGNGFEGVYVNEINQEVKQYNNSVYPEERLTTKQSLKPISKQWTIPDYYKQLSLKDFFVEKLSKMDLSEEQFRIRIKRVLFELKYFEKNNNDIILRALIYIINTLHSNNQVWGIGRGSSVSSYLLYLIGVHDVDSIEYELDFFDFFHD